MKLIPRVSIIIPTYNRPKLLKKSIQSVLNQTFQNFEIIVINDGSTKDIKNIEILDNRIKLIKTEHKGAGHARNIGLRESRGEYIAFLDDDDIFLKNKLEYQIDIMEKNKNYVISHTSYFSKIEDKLIKINSSNFRGHVFPKILVGCPIALPTVMIRKKFFDHSSIRFPEINFAEDIFLWIQILKNNLLLGINKPLSIINITNENTGNNINNQIILYSQLFEYLKKEHQYFINIRRKMYAKKRLNIGLLNFKTNHKLKAFKEIMFSLLINPFSIENIQIILNQITLHKK